MDPDLGILYLKSIKEMHDFEATIGIFIGLPRDEEALRPGVHVLISVVKMTKSEYDALPEFEV